MEQLTKQQILSEALIARDQELLGYQINIDNYTLAIEKITNEYPNNEDLQVFKNELQMRLEEELRQQLRCKIIRDIIALQVESK
jgi:hypothetical protein